MKPAMVSAATRVFRISELCNMGCPFRQYLEVPFQDFAGRDSDRGAGVIPSSLKDF